MLELGADDRQLDFPVIYTSAVHGYARRELTTATWTCSRCSTPSWITCRRRRATLTAPWPAGVHHRLLHLRGPHRHRPRRLGTVRSGARILVVKNGGRRFMATVKPALHLRGDGPRRDRHRRRRRHLRRGGHRGRRHRRRSPAPNGRIVLDPIQVEPPTLSVVFAASTSPLVGREGTIVGGRQLKASGSCAKAQSNIAMVIRETPGRSGMEVAGRGIPSTWRCSPWRPCAARASSSRWAGPR